MKEYNFFKLQGAVRPTEEQLLDTKLFYQNANTIYERFDDWKDNDRFYFIPLFMQMTYSCAGWAAEMAPDPVWLGSFVTAVRNHSDLFQFKCPECGKTVFPYRTVGSPLPDRRPPQSGYLGQLLLHRRLLPHAHPEEVVGTPLPGR